MSGHIQCEQVIHDLGGAQAISLLVTGSNQHRNNIARIALLALMTGNDLFQNRFDTRDRLTHTVPVANAGHIERQLGKGDAKGVIHCPGHTPGHVVLFESNEKIVFVGDCLFAGSIGRTDLPGGSSEQLMDSLFNKILPLGDDVEVYSGHGPKTTIGAERRTNPFLTGAYSIGGSGRI